MTETNVDQVGEIVADLGARQATENAAAAAREGRGLAHMTPARALSDIREAVFGTLRAMWGNAAPPSREAQLRGWGLLALAIGLLGLLAEWAFFSDRSPEPQFF